MESLVARKKLAKNSVCWGAHCDSVIGKSLRGNHLPGLPCRIPPPPVNDESGED